MSHQLVLTAVGASCAYNLAISGLFLILVQAQESQNAEDWAAGTLHRRRALAGARRRRREVEVRPYKPPLPYRRFSFNHVLPSRSPSIKKGKKRAGEGDLMIQSAAVFADAMKNGMGMLVKGLFGRFS